MSARTQACVLAIYLVVLQAGWEVMGDTNVYCSFYDDMYLAQRRLPPTQSPRSDLLSKNNMARRMEPSANGVIDPGSYGEVQKDNKTIKCPDSRNFCYTLWEGDTGDKNRMTVIKQGCWDQADRDSCEQSDCVARTAVNRRSNNTHFCCCTGDMCNVNVTSEYIIEQDPTPNLAATPRYQILPDPNYRYRTIIIALVSVAGVALVIALTYLAYRLLISSRKHPYEPEQLIEQPPTPMFDVDQLKLCSLISGGRYGDVWRGTLYDTEVAVKLFMPQQKQYFANERDIYTLPHMDHPALPKYFGSDEYMIQDGISPYSIVVMSYLPNGTLCQYLKENIIDWNQMCRLALSAASGLAHLHTDIYIGDKEKPAIAHRDINSRNILIKEDLTCCICDFGFAMKILGSKFIRNGFEEIAEQSPISDVGTLRYMAPEVLDGAVNLRDCEASLKQIDVYALGLVIWECASRCSDLYQGMPVPEYKLPFEAELGVHPTFEDMQRHVSWKRGRPIFPDVWKDSNQVIRALKETIEDSWDQDAEARLTSLCVEERMLEMAPMWDLRNKVGVTPTNPTTLITSMQDTILRNQTSEISTTGDNVNTDGNINIPNGTVVNINDLNLPPGVSVQRASRAENSVSSSTVETTLTSPSDPLPVIEAPPPGKTSNLHQKVRQPLQPHQGQNPTVERNTHKGSDDKLVILGNSLVDQSIAEEAQQATQAGEQPAVMGNTNANFTDDMFEAIADNLESSLVQNDLLGQQQYPTPASSTATASNTTPNIQSNRLHQHPPEQLIARPKQPNVPGNGSAYHTHHHPLPPGTVLTHGVPPHVAEAQPQHHPPAKQKNKFRFKKPKADKISGKMSGLYLFGKNLLKGASHDSSSDDGSNYFPTENLRNPAQMASGASKTPAPSAYTEIDLANPGKSNLEPRQVPTEVCLMNGQPVVRPMSLQVHGKEQPNMHNYNLRRHSSSDDSTDSQTLPKYHDTSEQGATGHTPPLAAEPVGQPQMGVTELGIAKLSEGGARPALHKVKLKSQSSIDLSPTAGESSDEEVRVRRPNSLSVNGHNYKKVPQSVPCLNNLGRDEVMSVNKPLLADHHQQQQLQQAQNQSSVPTVEQQDEIHGARRLNQDANGRYSVCDERPLSHSVGNMNGTSASSSSGPNSGRPAASAGGPNGQSSISLTQFGSVERGSANRLHHHQQPADYPC